MGCEAQEDEEKKGYVEKEIEILAFGYGRKFCHATRDNKRVFGVIYTHTN